MNRLLLVLLGLFLCVPLSGCPSNTNPNDDDTVANDDDATGDDDDATANDDDATGDDDDATGDDDDATGDDDDATGDDDDATGDDDDATGDDDDATGDDDDSTEPPVDNDGDGVDASTDCDDNDAANYPGNTEVCDGQDNDCQNGADADADGEVDADVDLSLSCDDCDDSDAANYPGNTEICDGQDNDCANGADADVAGEVDADSDLSLSCDDCDDADGSNYPGNTELCDDADNDCDTTTFAAGEDTDVDGDGSATCLDCDDGDIANFPGNTELCDGQDNDCIGGANADALGEVDGDLDLVLSCADCDDADAANYPGNTELCDGQDNDCNSTADFDVAGEVDGDGDGSISCEDCDDSDGTLSPGAPELCDGLDNNCDGAVAGLYTTATAATSYSGSDRVRGNAFLPSSDTLLTSFAMSLNAPAGAELNFGVYESATETGDYTLIATNSVVVPASLAGARQYISSGGLGVQLNAGTYYTLAVHIGSAAATYYLETGTAPSTTPFGTRVGSMELVGTFTSQPTSLSTNPVSSAEYDTQVVTDDEGDFDTDLSFACADCDDGDGNNAPGNTETCDGADNDCNWLADADVAGEVDGDGDLSLSCADCDDGNPGIYPGNVETCDGVDEDCDASTEAGDGETDDDGDGALNCSDCEDLEATAYPGAAEICDGLDTNCDGAVAGLYTTATAATSYSGPNRVRGNSFLPSSDTLLTSFAMSLNAPAGAELNFGVYESATETGDYTLIATNSVVVPASLAGARQYISSGGLGVQLNAGTYYTLAVHIGSTAATYYIQNGVNSSTTPFGTRVGSMEIIGTFTSQPTSLSEDPVSSAEYDTQVVTDDEGDVDTDLFVACEDCDDGDSTVFPGQTEICDDVDNDCSGTIDVFDFFDTNATPVAIDSSTSWNAQSSIEVPENGVVADVNVTLELTHSYTGDLDISLMSPAGTTIDLSSDNGGSGDNYIGTVFDDDGFAQFPVASGFAPFTATFTPEVPLSTFDGELSGGTWTLIVVDDFPGADDGTLTSWSIDLVLDGGACTAENCLEVLTASPNSGDGVYVLNPSGVQGAAGEYTCDMTNGGWTEVFFNDFDNIGPDAGWSTSATYDCAGDVLLGGYNNQAGGTINIVVDTSEFAHTEARIETEYWAMDSWDGENAWIDIDGGNIFAASFTSGGTPNLCGAANTGWTENIATVAQVVNHSGASLLYSAGSTLDQPADDESFGVDDVGVWVR